MWSLFRFQLYEQVSNLNLTWGFIIVSWCGWKAAELPDNKSELAILPITHNQVLWTKLKVEIKSFLNVEQIKEALMDNSKNLWCRIFHRQEEIMSQIQKRLRYLDVRFSDVDWIMCCGKTCLLQDTFGQAQKICTPTVDLCFICKMSYSQVPITRRLITGKRRFVYVINSISGRPVIEYV
jgi:hypothetical protein